MKDLPFLLVECFRDFVNHKVAKITFPAMKVDGDNLHLSKSMEWLYRSFEYRKSGFPSHYDLIRGKWTAPFPEVTGYIIPTFFDYANLTNKIKYRDAAIHSTEWLLKHQLKDGGCMQGLVTNKIKPHSIVFNTGQNIFGYIEAYNRTKEDRYLDAAQRSADFLVSSVDERGIWDKKYLYNNIMHSYNTRTSWALLELNKYVERKNYYRVATSNLNWVIENMTDDGWINYASFKPNEPPQTHGISYTLRGLVESYNICLNKNYLNAVLKSAGKFFRIFENRKRLNAFWRKDWTNTGKYFANSNGDFVCVTGNIQMAIVWMKLYQINKDIRFLNSAFKMIDQVKHIQNIKSTHMGINGGIKGSFPIYGSYSSLKYPTWAAKFFAEALMLKIKLKNELSTSIT